MRRTRSKVKYADTDVYSAEYDLFQVELSKNYGLVEWHDDLKKVMLKAGVDNNPVVFLFSDTQVSGVCYKYK